MVGCDIAYRKIKCYINNRTRFQWLAFITQLEYPVPIFLQSPTFSCKFCQVKSYDIRCELSYCLLILCVRPRRENAHAKPISRSFTLPTFITHPATFILSLDFYFFLLKLDALRLRLLIKIEITFCYYPTYSKIMQHITTNLNWIN